MTDLDIQYAVDAEALPSEADVLTWVEAALQQVQPDLLDSAQLTVRLVDEAEGTTLNETWRQKSGPTNVLSFPFEAPPGVELPLLGDIVICAPVILREAQAQGKTESAHWAHMVIHGVLHLLGYDHIDSQEADIMEHLEIQILQRLAYPNPYLS